MLYSSFLILPCVNWLEPVFSLCKHAVKLTGNCTCNMIYHLTMARTSTGVHLAQTTINIFSAGSESQGSEGVIISSNKVLHLQDNAISRSPYDVHNGRKPIVCRLPHRCLCMSWQTQSTLDKQ